MSPSEQPAVIKPWGREYLAFRNDDVAIWVLEIFSTLATSLHCHPRKNTALIVLRGEVELSFIRGVPRRMVGLDKINVFRGRFHQTRAISPGTATLLEIEAPDDKRDIVRLRDDHGRAGKEIEGAEAEEPRLDGDLWLGGRPMEIPLAGCMLRTVSPWRTHEILGMSESEVAVTLHGGLERGLLPPGDAVDGATLDLMASNFPMLPGSSFLMIRRI